MSLLSQDLQSKQRPWLYSGVVCSVFSLGAIYTALLTLFSTCAHGCRCCKVGLCEDTLGIPSILALLRHKLPLLKEIFSTLWMFSKKNQLFDYPFTTFSVQLSWVLAGAVLGYHAGNPFRTCAKLILRVFPLKRTLVVCFWFFITFLNFGSQSSHSTKHYFCETFCSESPDENLHRGNFFLEIRFWFSHASSLPVCHLVWVYPESTSNTVYIYMWGNWYAKLPNF